jgi:hypothetical protein
MLAVPIDEEDEGACRIPEAGLDGGAIAFVVRVLDDARAGRSGALRGLILRSIVDNQYFAPVRRLAKPADERANRRLFVEGRHNDGRGIG